MTAIAPTVQGVPGEYCGLRMTAEGWKICRKYIVLKNDYVPTMLDIYNI